MLRLPCTPASLLACTLLLVPAAALAQPVPLHDHVVVVVMENKNYDQVRVQPYTASLIAQGASFKFSFGVTHPSQPNYIALWAGNTLGITNDNCPPAGTPHGEENFGHSLEVAGKTWRAYSENLAVAGSSACSYDGNSSTGLYTRKHDPWTNFSNLDHLNERPYSDLAADLAALPNLAFIIPNNCHNTHNSSTPGCGIADGDAWLANNLPAILSAMGPNGLLILTWDEDDNVSGNHILTVFVGPHVTPGYQSVRTISHYSVVSTICAVLGIPSFGSAAFEEPITDVWMTPTATAKSGWGRIKTLYR
jgi:hypothetical protein